MSSSKEYVIAISRIQTTKQNNQNRNRHIVTQKKGRETGKEKKEQIKLLFINIIK